MNFLDKFRIPTLLGLTLILLGLGSGIYLVLQQQITLTRAAPDVLPQNIQLTNVSDEGVTLSWTTSSVTIGFVTFGKSRAEEQTVTDDQDLASPKMRTLHYVNIKNLTPDTTYQYKIKSGKITTKPASFKTAPVNVAQNNFQPIIGSVINGDQPLKEGIVYLTIDRAIVQSALIKELGNFIIPINSIRTSEGTLVKIEVISQEERKGSATFVLSNSSEPIGPLKLGQDLDFSTEPKALGISVNKFDLNGDGIVNSKDYSLVLKNLNKVLKDSKFDLNSDKKVDKKDLEIISNEIKNNKFLIGKPVNQ